MEVSDGVEALLDVGLAVEGAEDPFAQEARAHGGDGLVEDGEEGVALGVGEDGFDEFEVALADAVEDEAVVGLVGGEGGELGGLLAQKMESSRKPMPRDLAYAMILQFGSRFIDPPTSSDITK